MATIVETTDATQDSGTVYQMAAGDVFFGTMSPSDADWIKVKLIAGHTYSFAAVGLGAVGSGVTDPFLALHSAGGKELAYQDDSGPGLTAFLTYTAARTGTFFIEAGSYESGPAEDYGLSMTEGAQPSLGIEMAAGDFDPARAVLGGHARDAGDPDMGRARQWPDI